MILIGQYDSSFVRRVGIALKLYGLPFEQFPWSVFSDKEKIRPYNPLMRVPVLVLDDGAVLVDSHLIIDHLDRQVPPEKSLFPPRAGPSPCVEGCRSCHRTGRQMRQPFLRRAVAQGGVVPLGRTLPRPDCRRA